MSNGNVYERLLKLTTTANKQVMDGNKSAEDLCDLLQKFIEEKNKNTPYLRHLLSLSLAPTSGAMTIAAATDVFTGYLDPDFENWGTNKAGADSGVTKVDVFEMTKEGTHRQLFGSLGRNPRSLCLTQGEIVEFCLTHPEHLRQEGFGTFFLFTVKSENDQKIIFVVNVLVRDGWLDAHVYRFKGDDVWNANPRRRLVVKQQTI